ncbi:MAG: hypothetical protein AAF282_17080 [Cyanobacteria bacterium P01_A01_bin.15]
MSSLSTYLPPQATLGPPSAPEVPNLQRLGTRCWKTLVNNGVPSEHARELAAAIIHFLYANSDPSPHERHLIDRYCKQIRAAGLWQLELG